MNSNSMVELTDAEINAVGGAGYVKDVWKDVRDILKELPGAYDDAIQSMADMMCRATNAC